ncbi:protein translocase subunit SecD [Paracoccaceae bacterium]|nr:protein translocase subunit SecD [Paracoccaceae bacterium]
MPKFSFLKIFLVSLTCLIAFLFASPNFFYNAVDRKLNNPTQSSSWPNFLPSTLVKLGLDLRGGVYMLLEVKTDKVIREKFDFLWTDMRSSLVKKRKELGSIRRIDTSGDQLQIEVGNPDGVDFAIKEIEKFNSSTELFSSRWSGSVSRNVLEISSSENVVTIAFSDEKKTALEKQVIDQSLEIIRRRVDETGTREPTIQRQGRKRILVQVPGLGSSDELIALLGKTAKLTFNEVVSMDSSSNFRANMDEIVVGSEQDNELFFLLKKRPVVSGENLTNAQPSFDENGMPAVSFNFNPSAALKFGNYTKDNIGSPFAIVLDDLVISAPTIQSHIPGGSGIITGNFSVEESNRLAILLRSGALPAKIEVLELRTIGPELGRDSINAGRSAALIGGLLVLIFMWLSYGLFGIFANVALFINIVLVMALLSIVGATLTLPGIAGIVLTIGMAVDANVLIFERIKEELKKNSSIYNSIKIGYEKALSSIVDANVTTMIAAVILFFFGSGPVKGFSVTLGLGIITSVFTALLITRLFIDIYILLYKPKVLRV